VAAPAPVAPPVAPIENAPAEALHHSVLNAPREVAPADHQSLDYGDFSSPAKRTAIKAEQRATKEAMQADMTPPPGTTPAVHNKQMIEHHLGKLLKGSAEFQALTDHSPIGHAIVRTLIATWAGSSGDHNSLSCAMQLATKDAFGMKAEDLEMMQLSATHGRHEDEVYKDAALILGVNAAKLGTLPGGLDTVKTAMRHFIAAQHEHTQAYFKKHKITHVVVARGMKKPGPAERTISKIKLQPASSFSTSIATAKAFAGTSGMVMMARVPVSQVLGSFRSGFGCTSENELVLLNHPQTRVVHLKSSKVTAFSSLIDG